MSFFYLDRKLFDNWLWKDKPFARGQAWIDLIGIANHAPGKFLVRGILVNVERGQVGWSQPKMAVRWGWSRHKVSDFLNLLEKEQQIVQQKNFVTSIITILNYDLYQQPGQQKGQQTDSRRTADGP